MTPGKGETVETREDQRVLELGRGRGEGRNTVHFQGSEAILYSTVVADSHHRTFGKAHRMCPTKSEPMSVNYGFWVMMTMSVPWQPLWVGGSCYCWEDVRGLAGGVGNLCTFCLVLL